MAVLKLVLPGADFSSVGIGRFYDLPDIRGSLYAAYLLGSAYSGGGLKDLTRNGRDLTLASGSLGAKSLQCGAGVFAKTPILGTTLAAVAGAVSMVVIAKAAAGVGHILAGTLVTGGTGNENLGLVGQSDNSSRAYNGTQAAVTPVDATRGTAYDTCASVHTPTVASVYRKTGTSASQFVTLATATLPNFGGAGMINFGDAGLTAYNSSAPEIVAALLYATQASQADLDYVQANMKTLLATYGVSI